MRLKFTRLFMSCHNKYPVEVYGKFIYETPDSFGILAYVSDKCNYNCEYCYNKFPRSNKDLDLEKLYDFVVSCTKQKSFILLDLIGGETTLHPKLYDFCKKVVDNIKNIQITIYSNFSKDISFYKRFLNIGVNFILSWHSQCNTDEFICKLNEFNEEDRNKITIAVMYEHNNIARSLEAFDRIYKIPRFSELQFSFLEMSDNYNGYKYTDLQLEEFNKRIPYTKTQSTIIKFNDGTIEEVNDNYFFSDHSHTRFKFWLCNAGMDFIYIHWNGDVHPCDENDNNVIYNIYSGKEFIIPKKPILCKYENCPCLFDIYKKRVLR